MGQHLLAGNPPVPLTLRRSSRARRISLRISGLDGRVTLTLPDGASERAALEFARSKGDWLRAQLRDRPAGLRVGIGSEIPVEGRRMRIGPARGRRTEVTGDAILLPGAEAEVPARLLAFLKARARDRLAAASDRHAAALGLGYTRLSIRDTRSRWGSCSAAGRLMYSWRLILAPPDVLDYVAAHEVAHLAEMNHSPAFWALVGRLQPDYREPRAWLRRNGADLHRYRFGD